jgi:hypothetical protein
MHGLRPLLILLIATLAGCGKQSLEFREVKRVHDKVTEAELKRFLRIVDSLPDKKLPDFPPVYRPLPNWAPGRTLPVNELAKEEQELLDEAWDVDALARQLKGNRTLDRAVRREQLTLEQFVGLMLAIGAARSRSMLRKDQDLDAVIKHGETVSAQLEKDTRKFANLSREARYSVLRHAGWITRVHRASLLKEVPPENIALVKANAARLDKVLPEYFRVNPLDAIADLLEEQGMPFEELPPSGRDDEITWGPDDNPLSGAPSSNGDAKPGTPGKFPATPATKR